MKTFLSILLLLLFSCQYSSKSSIPNKYYNFITVNEDLVATNSDSLILTTSRHSSDFTVFCDSSNSYCQLSKDTLTFHLSTGEYEESYILDIQIINGHINTSCRLFNNQYKYNYDSSLIQITLNRNKFQINDFVIAQIDYKAKGKPLNIRNTQDDTIRLKGKIKLKVRNAEFTEEDLSVENNRKDFYALLLQTPDTIKAINLYGCAFTDLPTELAYFPNLEELDLTGNDMSLSDFKVLREFKKLKSLNLTECNLQSLPAEVLKLRKLENLNIWNNKINNIPDELYEITSLKNLTIGHNNLSYLSPKISRLVNLETFESSASNIKAYPKEMSRLKKLNEIYPNDKMDYIPTSLIKFTIGCNSIINR